MGEALRSAVRQAARSRRVPENARCGDCGFADPVALVARGKAWRCYQCDNLAHGRSPDEAHHVLGKRFAQ